ncbi:MAG: N-formylglutamate amidohydrolase [Cyclobacteriaceae bacterium]|nr:N-formylglutamate amidohydrolase [Cyclobacteriaceae bacterium]
MTAVFNLTLPTQPEVPILISVPHCGIAFPNELRNQYKPELIQAPDDTDWFVDQLYDFAPSLGITMIKANYSRWVIDLNRDPQSKPLYSDGRVITGLCPTTNFLGEPIYKDERNQISLDEIEARVKQYYLPYHTRIEAELTRLYQKFGKVLLWDCHSIRQVVPSIHSERFPDLILGDADGTSASSLLIDVAVESLQNSGYSFSHNHPFKGGYITRHYGTPEVHRHALQLEMSKINYMDESELHYDEDKAAKIQLVLTETFAKLTQSLAL